MVVMGPQLQSGDQPLTLLDLWQLVKSTLSVVSLITDLSNLNGLHI